MVLRYILIIYLNLNFKSIGKCNFHDALLGILLNPTPQSGYALRTRRPPSSCFGSRSSFYSSNLYARGVEVKIISKLLGHASVEITYNRYIHFFEGEIDDTLRQAVGV